ncbi:LOB domain-containing protein 24-like [Actinidia eriantha]|uniref:LOB domain-containing protein 24-like n=1 Tax=Actinidia eriantha TaxID=165200 RepID=UPI00258DC86D|nr:LOB domain-containing protein 24-like [Actinidia eriantha]
MQGGGVNINAVACAACRHQRKRCEPYCPLRKYFPSNKEEVFLSVHKLYGVNNFLKIIGSVPFHLEHKTAQTLIFEAKVRSQFPVLGSLALQAWIKARIMECEKELEVVKKELAIQEEKKKSQDPNETNLTLHTNFELKSRGKQPMVCDDDNNNGEEMEGEATSSN